MNGIAEDLNLEVEALLKRHLMLGNWTLLTMIATGFGGLYWTYVCDLSDALTWAVITFCVTMAEGFLVCYHLSRRAFPVNNPSVILTGLLALGGAAVSGWLLYYSWAEYFISRDDDAGLAVALIALYIFFKPMQYLFVLYNYKKGVFHQMLEMNEQSGN